jgi:hypothetical protein
MAGNGAAIIALDKKRMDAMGAKDIATLNTVIADDLIYTHSSARMDTKATLIGAMESGATLYTSVVPSDVVAQDLGEAVVLTGVAAISVMSGGKPNSFRELHRRLRQTGRQLANGHLAVHPPRGLNRGNNANERPLASTGPPHAPVDRSMWIDP